MLALRGMQLKCHGERKARHDLPPPTRPTPTTLTGSRDVSKAKEAAAKLSSEIVGGGVNINSGSLSQAAAEADVIFWVAGPTGSACKSVRCEIVSRGGEVKGGWTNWFSMQVSEIVSDQMPSTFFTLDSLIKCPAHSSPLTL